MIFFSCGNRHLVTNTKIASSSLKGFFKHDAKEYFQIYDVNNMFELESFKSKDNSFTFVIRNPYERYISGVLEILKYPPFDKNEEDLNNFEFTKDLLKAVFSKLRGDPSFGNDAHVENWLFNILICIIEGLNIEIIDVSELNDWISLHFSHNLPKYNTKQNQGKNVIDILVKDTDIFNHSEYYLLSETNTYNWLTSENFKTMSTAEKVSRAKDLLTETIHNKFGHITFSNAHNLSLDKNLNFCNDFLNKIEH